ncbi:WD repeat-containing protein 27 [Gaertneriomyces sp. JEL0708]|nr:WD repeat-containing protein 27 [Gaertneriomyces sp. JEL0708]
MLSRPPPENARSKRHDSDLSKPFRFAVDAQFRASPPISPSAIALTQGWLAYPVGLPRSAGASQHIAVVSSQDAAGEAILYIPTSHKASITATCFGRKRLRTLLVTGSSDALYLWELPRHCESQQRLSQPKGRLLATDIGTINHISINDAATWVAVCLDESVYVLEISSNRTVRLEGHLSTVTGITFFPNTDESQVWLASISQDRTFKVWDVANETCLYQSPIISPCALTCIAIDPLLNRLCIGSEDGKVRFYETTPRRGNPVEPRSLTTLDTVCLVGQDGEEEKKDEPISVVSSLPDWRTKPQHKRVPTPDDDESTADFTAAILGLAYCSFRTHRNIVDHETPDERLRLLIGCSSRLLIFDPGSYELLAEIPYQRFPFGLPPAEDLRTKQPLGIAGVYAFASCGGALNTCSVACGNVFSGVVSLLRVQEVIPVRPRSRQVSVSSSMAEDIDLPTLVKSAVTEHVKGAWSDNVYKDVLTSLAKLEIRSLDDIAAAADVDLPVPGYVQEAINARIGRASVSVSDDAELSFEISDTTEFATGSPLKPKKLTSNSSLTSKKQVTPRSKKGGVHDQPVTFHSKVKSSGYTQAPQVRKLFTQPGKKASPSPRKLSGHVPTALYPDVPLDKRMTLPSSVHHTRPVTAVSFSPTGLCASASADATARYHRFSKEKIYTKDLIGHNGPLTSVTWSAQASATFGQLLLTSSLDGSCRLWSVTQADPLLQLKSIHGSNSNVAPKVNKPGLAKASIPKIKEFQNEIRNVRFYYKDKFVVVPCGSSFYLYSYHLAKLEKGSVKPGLNYHSYKLEREFNVEAHSVTALGCVNTRKSGLMVTGMSDKTVRIWDIARCEVVRRVDAAHTRVVHAIGVADYIDGGGMFENMFATSAVTDSIKCWDLRTPRSVLHLHGHVNQHATVHCAISPCGKFLATGSEDNHAYVYDLRKGAVMYRVGGHKDAVATVAFDSTSARLATGSHDGKLLVQYH